jgi:hypothetical protein
LVSRFLTLDYGVSDLIGRGPLNRVPDGLGDRVEPQVVKRNSGASAPSAWIEIGGIGKVDGDHGLALSSVKTRLTGNHRGQKPTQRRQVQATDDGANTLYVGLHDLKYNARPLARKVDSRSRRNVRFGRE